MTEPDGHSLTSTVGQTTKHSLEVFLELLLVSWYLGVIDDVVNVAKSWQWKMTSTHED